MTPTKELLNLHRVIAAAADHVTELADKLSTATVHLKAQLDRAAGLDPSQEAEPSTRKARDLLALAEAFIADVEAQRPIDTGWR